MSNQTKNATLVGGGGQKPLNSQSLETKEILRSKIQDSKIQLESNSPKLKDSNSKLESKNPNKIQTTKIQSSKASKDLVNPQSPKVVESNPKLDSKNTRESKKIQRVKNTYDSTTIQNPTNSQKSKESSKVKTLIRTIPVSIALASALSSHAVAVDGWQVHNIPYYPNYNNGTIVSNPDATFGVAGNDIMVPVPNNGTINISAWNQVVRYVYYVSGGTAGDLTIQQGTTFRMLYLYDAFIKVGLGNGNVGSVGTILNQGTILKSNDSSTIPGVRPLIEITENSSFDAIVNEGRIVSQNGNTNVRSQIIKLKNSSQGNLLKNTGTIIGSGDLIRIESSSLGKIELSGGLLQVDSGNVIGIQGSSNIGTITADDATINGGISLSNTSSITNGISLSNTSTLTGNISLTNNSRIQGGIVLDNSKMTGGITLGGSSNIAGISLANASTITGGVTLNGSSSIDNISISGSNASLGGNITMLSNDNTSSIDNITISNGGTFGGTIRTAGRTNISGITIANGGVVGSNTANSMILSSGNSTIHNIDIQNGGTMYGNIEAHWAQGGNAGAVDNKDGNIGDVSIAGRLQGDIAIRNKVAMNSLTMSENGTITGSVKVGDDGDSSQTPTLSTITLSDNSGINAIVLGNNGARATINSLTLNDNSSIGTITNNSNATIVNLTLNETSTITNGITNEANGNIGTIISNTNANVSNTINNEGTIAKLLLNQGTINYSGNSGFFKEELVVGRDATLTINNGGSGNGTIYIKFDTDAQVGTINNLGTILGNIDNQTSSTIKTFNTGSISGSIINNTNATIETLNVTGNVTNGITNNSNIGSLIVNENVSYSGSGSISNALEVAQGDTLTIGGNGTLNFDSDNGTINNAGTINGNITNIANSILTDFTNSGSISGTFTNKGHIVKFVNESTGNINSFVNNNTISFFENNGTIATFGGTGTIYGVINSKTITNGFENVATSLWNKENALITGNVALKGDYKDCSNSGSTICNTSDLINEGTITGNVTNDKGKEINLVENTGTIEGSIANSGSINTLEVSGDIAGGITNNSNIGTLKVYESVTYNGNGNRSDRITQALEVAKDKTLTIGNNGTLSFNSKNGNVNNLGTI
ncbi:beta strand repeat-containing protein, partial [Helicobacter pullorum]|uniref:beta strand repeat-containing protein n=1 Tax=Helicobacter pullorum TaxID=35818 RepID=UPI0011818334